MKNRKAQLPRGTDGIKREGREGAKREGLFNRIAAIAGQGLRRCMQIFSESGGGFGFGGDVHVAGVPFLFGVGFGASDGAAGEASVVGSGTGEEHVATRAADALDAAFAEAEGARLH